MPHATVHVEVSGVKNTLRPAIEKIVKAVMRGEAGERTRWSVSVAGVSMSAIRRLNRRYRGKDKATDVLSFAYGDTLAGRAQYGEIVLCLAEARRRSRSAGIPFWRTFGWLIVHGCLHVLGHDHSTATQERAMKAREDRHLKRLENYLSKTI